MRATFCCILLLGCCLGWICDANVGVKVIEVQMPMLSSTMTEGTISNWDKSIGDKVTVGSRLLTVESDKAEMDVESFEDGYLAQILVEPGTTVKVGAVLAFLVKTPEDIKKLQTEIDLTAQPSSSPLSSTIPNPPALPSPASPPTATPSAHLSPAGANPASSVKHRMPVVNKFVPFAVDQDIRDQLPANMSADQLHDELFHRVAQNPQLQRNLDKIETVPGGTEFLRAMHRRARMRAPPQVYLQPDVVDDRDSWTASAHSRESSRTMATPSAQNLAKSKNVEITAVRGTGNFGRVTLADVENHLQIGRTSQYHRVTPVDSLDGNTPAASNTQLPPPQNNVSLSPLDTKHREVDRKQHAADKISESQVQPLSTMQKAIAKTMQASVHIPVFRLSRAVGTDGLQEVYSKLKKRGVTWSTLLAKAVGVVLARPEHAIINAIFDAENTAIIYHPRVNIGMAVASNDGGLFTPVLNDVSNIDLFELSRRWSDLVQKVSQKTIRPNDCAGATFYISNLGQFGVDQFDAILPPAVGCILSVGTSAQKVLAPKKGETFFGMRSEMVVTITCDHRHINGADAAKFLQEFSRFVEDSAIDVLTS